MAFGAIAASDAFLEQQEVQSVCDGAALAAANATDEGALYATGVGTALPLTRASTQAAVADQLADGGTTLHAWSTETDGVEVTVRCTRHVQIDRKSTRLNSSHANISYAVFCLKKKNI